MIDLQKYTVRLGTEKDAAIILELINVIQPEDSWSLEHFLWQYYTGTMNTMVYLIFHQNVLVSLYVAVPKRINIQGEIREGFMVQDVMTHPDYRGQGFLHYLSSLCTKAILERNEIAYTFPNKHSENSFRRNGWTELSKTPLRTMTVDSSEKSHNKEFAIEPTAQFDERVDKIWNESGLQIGVQRDSSFLNWRYSRPATSYFRFYILKDKGFLILKLFNNGDKRILHVLDIVISKSATDYVPSVLTFIKQFALKNGAALITCWLDEAHCYAPVFDAFGFSLDLQNNRYVFVLAPEKDLKTFSSSNLWHLTQGDSDVY